MSLGNFVLMIVFVLSLIAFSLLGGCDSERHPSGTRQKIDELFDVYAYNKIIP